MKLVLIGLFVVHVSGSTLTVVKNPQLLVDDTSSWITFGGKAAQRIVKVISDIFKKEDLKPLPQYTGGCKSSECNTSKPKDCGELDKDTCPSGIYTIFPKGTAGFEVFCEMEKNGGGWTVIQRRQDGSVDFFRGWESYKRGFGSLNGEFWLGNDHIHQITSQGSYSLRIDLEDFDDKHTYATYSTFSVKSIKDSYELHVGGYSGNAGDSLSYHSGSKFSTKDKDYDQDSRNCAETFKGAWWYKVCHNSNLNGQYLKGIHKSFADGINWYHGKGYHYSMKSTVMMIKRI